MHLTQAEWDAIPEEKKSQRLGFPVIYTTDPLNGTITETVDIVESPLRLLSTASGFLGEELDYTFTWTDGERISQAFPSRRAAFEALKAGSINLE